MSRTYQSNNKHIELDINSAGCCIISLLTTELKLPLSDASDTWYQTIPYTADKQTANEIANKLTNITQTQLDNTYNKTQAFKLFDGEQQEFKQWIDKLANFMQECNGYTTH